MSGSFPKDFNDVLAFHGHLCLDIAMGYRVAKTALEFLGPLAADTKKLVATVGNDTCAVDAMQTLTGCTFGKRNLVPALTGKPVYRWQHTDSGHGVRIYVHYWRDFDADGHFRATQRLARGGKLATDALADFDHWHGELIDFILTAPAEDLFTVDTIDQPPPPKSGGFDAAPCAACGESTKLSFLRRDRCPECQPGTSRGTGRAGINERIKDD